MGWTSQYRPKGTSNRDFFTGLLGPGSSIVECATVRGTFYAAVRNEDTEQVWALVALTQWQPRSDFNFSYKDMSEDMGPCAYDAPARVLDALTETTSEYALAWRQACREQLAKKAAVPRVRIGDTIELVHPVRFTNGDVVDTLTLVSRGVFVDPTTRRRYRLPDYRRRAFRLVGVDA